MARPWTSALLGSVGLVALTAPESVASALAVLPLIDAFPHTWLVQSWGVVYLVVGGATFWIRRKADPIDVRRASAIAIAAGGAQLLLTFALAESVQAGVERFSWSVAAVVPAVAGAAERPVHRLALFGLAAIPFVVATATLEPVPGFVDRTPTVFRALNLTLLSLAAGTPLLVIGWNTRDENRNHATPT